MRLIQTRKRSFGKQVLGIVDRLSRDRWRDDAIILRDGRV